VEGLVDVEGSCLVIDRKCRGWWMWKAVVWWLMECGGAGGCGGGEVDLLAYEY
jgi:hypothetical protein